MYPSTSSHITTEENDGICRMLECYFARSEGKEALNYRVSRLTGGMNNSTYLIQWGEECYVLRRYNSHQDTQKVQYEHSILKKLAIHKRDFVIPQLVHTLDDNTFASIDGKIGALFHYQEGRNAQLIEPSHYWQLGQKSGQLSLVLSDIRVPLLPVYPPYYKLDLAYPECSSEDFVHFLRQPDSLFRDLHEETTGIADRVEQLFIKIGKLEHFPHQIVHGDLNASNVLVSEQGDITTILDFEFATWDLRVMELAVPLSDIISAMMSQDGHAAVAEEITWRNVKALIDGYQSEVQLLPGEIDILPSLLLLRRVDVVMHFLTRFNKGIDTAEVVTHQLQELARCVRWLGANQSRLMCLL